VQKAVVVIADNPQSFGLLRTRLGFVASAWFAQRDFADTEILKRFQESLAEGARAGTLAADTARDQTLGMSLRELVREFKWQTLVLLKCCLLQRKVRTLGALAGGGKMLGGWCFQRRRHLRGWLGRATVCGRRCFLPRVAPLRARFLAAAEALTASQAPWPRVSVSFPYNC
jgi:hypothetical protein